MPLLGGRVKWAYGPLRDDLVGPKSGLGAAGVRVVGVARWNLKRVPLSLRLVPPCGGARTDLLLHVD